MIKVYFCIGNFWLPKYPKRHTPNNAFTMSFSVCFGRKHKAFHSEANRNSATTCPIVLPGKPAGELFPQLANREHFANELPGKLAGEAPLSTRLPVLPCCWIGGTGFWLEIEGPFGSLSRVGAAYGWKARETECRLRCWKGKKKMDFRTKYNL